MAIPRMAFAILALATACDARKNAAPVPDRSAGVAVASPIDPPAAPGALAPYLAAVDGGVLASWLEPDEAGGHRLRMARWGRGTWGAPRTITTGTKLVANWADVPAIARAGDGALIASWLEASGSGEAYDAIVARSVDDGGTWTRLGPLHADRTPAEHGFVSLIADGDGARAFWLDGRDTGHEGGATMLRTARVGATVTDETAIDTRVCDCCATSAAQTDDGPRVAYRDRSADEIRDVAMARPGATGWDAAGVAADGWQIAGCPVNGPSIAARGRLVAVAWYTYAGNTHRVRAAFSRDAGATFEAPIEIDAPAGQRAPVGRVAIALDDDDTALVSWVASAREDATILVRRAAADGRIGPELAIASTAAGRDAGFPRMAVYGEQLVFAWTDPRPPSRIHANRVPRKSVAPVAGTPDRAAVTSATARPGPGVSAPAITATTLDGKAIDLASLRGRGVLVNLWATWCEPCRAEMPELAALEAAYRARGFSVIGLDVDRGKPAAEIAAFVARRKVPYTIWIDPDNRAAAALGVTTYPVSVLIDAAGTIRWRRDGAVHRDDADLRAAIEAVLTPAR